MVSPPMSLLPGPRCRHGCVCARCAVPAGRGIVAASPAVLRILCQPAAAPEQIRVPSVCAHVAPLPARPPAKPPCPALPRWIEQASTFCSRLPLSCTPSALLSASSPAASSECPLERHVCSAGSMATRGSGCLVPSYALAASLSHTATPSDVLPLTVSLPPYSYTVDITVA